MKRKNLLTSKIFAILLFLFALPTSILADDPPPLVADPPPTLFGRTMPSSPSTVPTISVIVDNILGYLFPIAGIICVIFIIQGGYMWIISAGDPDRIKQAQGTLTWAVLGLIFVMLIYAILEIILRFVYSA